VVPMPCFQYERSSSCYTEVEMKPRRQSVAPLTLNRRSHLSFSTICFSPEYSILNLREAGEREAGVMTGWTVWQTRMSSLILC